MTSSDEQELRLDSGASLTTQLYRDAAGDVVETIRILDDQERPGDERVHEVRKILKRVRTRFRLLKGSASPGLDEAVHSLVRLASRVLAPLRDQDIIPQVVGDLLKRVKKEELFEEIREGLCGERSRAKGSRATADHLMTRGHDILSGLETILAEPIRLEGDLPMVEKNLRRIYRRGRTLAKAKRLAPEQLHSLRKRVKDLYHISGFFDAEKLYRSTKELGDVLGEHQDLTVLEDFLNASGMHDDPRLEQEIRSLSMKRRKVLASRGMAAARRLFRKSPRRFMIWLKEAGRQF